MSSSGLTALTDPDAVRLVPITDPARRAALQAWAGITPPTAAEQAWVAREARRKRAAREFLIDSNALYAKYARLKAAGKI